MERGISVQSHQKEAVIAAHYDVLMALKFTHVALIGKYQDAASASAAQPRAS
jgi:cell fate (sporulation/competence/biofilm development) regulator YmcA (YheA/YmcA/DUF963 family)